MDNQEKFDETAIPSKEAFYSELNLEGISDADCAHAQKVWKVLGIKNHCEYHDLYAQSDTLLLADMFENFRDKCHEICIYNLILYICVFTRISMARLLKKTGVKLELLTAYDTLLMVENGIRGGICQAKHRYAKANNKYIKIYDKSIKQITYMDGQCLKNYP